VISSSTRSSSRRSTMRVFPPSNDLDRLPSRRRVERASKAAQHRPHARTFASRIHPPGCPGAKVRVARVAEKQSGVVTRTQLIECGLGAATISRWVEHGHLHRIHQGVYSVGHRGLSVHGHLVAALFYAGPGAALSHGTAAWWWRLIEARPRRIDISIRGRLQGRRGFARPSPGRRARPRRRPRHLAENGARSGSRACAALRRFRCASLHMAAGHEPPGRGRR
jgi:hypothetical protein